MNNDFKDWQRMDRPSYFGKHRDEIEQNYNYKYGKANWKIVWDLPDGLSSFDRAIQLYEDAYYDYLKTNKKLLDSLCNEASEVYDNAVSNVDCGESYHAQENNSNHYQDISVRKSVFRLGRKFNGTKLIQIRHNSSSPIGQTLSPGRVPFHLPHYVIQPVKTGWWKPRTVEEFWQSGKVLIVARKKEKVKSNA